LAQILALFGEDCRRLMDEMHAAVTEGDAARLGRTAHTLKGMLGNLSATASCEAATRLEACAREGAMTDAPGAYRVLEAEIERLHAALAGLGPCLPCPNGERK